MFDLAWSELLVVGLVAVLVLGPKELPQAMRTFAKGLRKVRSLGAEFQGHFNEMVREAELDEVRKQVQKFSQTSLTEHVSNLVDPKGEIQKEVETTFGEPEAKPLPAPEPGMDGAPLAGSVTPDTPSADTAPTPASGETKPAPGP